MHFWTSILPGYPRSGKIEEKSGIYSATCSFERYVYQCFCASLKTSNSQGSQISKSAFFRKFFRKVNLVKREIIELTSNFGYIIYKKIPVTNAVAGFWTSRIFFVFLIRLFPFSRDTFLKIFLKNGDFEICLRCELKVFNEAQKHW